MTWKVSYTDLATKAARYPFYKLTAYVAADSRKDAIQRVQSRFAPPKYGEYRASKAPSASPNPLM